MGSMEKINYILHIRECLSVHRGVEHEAGQRDKLQFINNFGCIGEFESWHSLLEELKFVIH